MAARRGDKFVENNINDDVIAKHETEVNIDNIERNGDQTPLVDPELIETDNESTYEHYTGFQKITTIPAAALSLVAGFIMIASVSVTIPILILRLFHKIPLSKYVIMVILSYIYISPIIGIRHPCTLRKTT